MADAPDPKVSAAYRELGAEEPPHALDQAILAASRRPRASSRPWTQRYAAPLGLAAVLVLSVTVTLRIQHEQPGIESIARQEPAAKAATAPAAPAAAPEAALKLKPELQIKQPEATRERMEARKARGEPKPFPAQAPAAPPPASADMLASRADMARNAEASGRGMSERQAEERTARDAEAATRAHQFGALQALSKRADSAPAAAASAPAPAAAPAAKLEAAQPAKASADTPEAELERIALLRRDGRHEEADKALAEFRKRYPDFKLTDAQRQRVERR
jgi:hypothetical protein